MIETSQSISIDAAIESVWDYVRDIRRWANLMPGARECIVIDDNDSRWVLKVGAGGLVRTVNVLVHVERWDGPQRVEFKYRLDGDPVEGGGTYSAVSKGARETEITLSLSVVGSGPMAPMWEAICKPLLPQLAKSFAGQLKGEIERAATDAAPPPAAEPAPRPSFLAALRQRLRALWQSLRPTRG